MPLYWLTYNNDSDIEVYIQEASHVVCALKAKVADLHLPA